MKRLIDYEKELNPSQLKAVKSVDGPYLVIAGAGSGKTRILVYRVAYLVEHGIKPEQILLLTFTRKASQEMIHRASMILDDRCSRVSGGTFHSFANMALRQYAPRLGLPKNFTIMDQADAENVVNNVRKNLGYDKKEQKFPKKKAILNIISKSVNTSFDIPLIIEADYPHFYKYAEDIKKINEYYSLYKRKSALLDYDDLLLYLKNLLSIHKDIRSQFSLKYRYIMVDEYQDTNKLQADILHLLLHEHKNIMAVGDDSQSIYGFRGANFRNIMDFPKVFNGAEIIPLEENYRSIQPILDLTNHVIDSAVEKFTKNLFTRKKGGNQPVFIEIETENNQSKRVVEEIFSLTEQGVPMGDIAILFRSGWHSNDLEIELSRHRIPFLKYGGQKFIDAAHVKDVISHIQVIYNPYNEINWQRILTLIPGIGPKTAQKIVEKVTKDGKFLSPDDLLLKKIKGVKELNELLLLLKQENCPPLEAIRKLNSYYGPILKTRYDDFHKRISDLVSLEKIAARYENIEEFLADMALDPPEQNIVQKGTHDNKDKSKLVLSTIHSAKGLEWHTVFVIHVSEGYIPSYQSFGSDEAIEEERRLLYVAMTRAKERLFLLKPFVENSPRSYMMGKDNTSFIKISRFLNENKILRKYLDFISF